MQALRHLRQISQEVSQPSVTGWGRRPAALRALSQRLSRYAGLILQIITLNHGLILDTQYLTNSICRGFNEALNGFTDEGWSMLESDGIDDVTVHVNSSPSKMMGVQLSYVNGFPSMSNAVLCAKASMLLQVMFWCYIFTWWKKDNHLLGISRADIESSLYFRMESS